YVSMLSLLDALPISPASESPNFLDGANWLVGTTGTALEYTPGSFRLTNGAYNGDVFSPKFYASGWKGGSVARIKTYNLAKIGKRSEEHTSELQSREK